MSTITGYIRRLDLDGNIRIRQKEDLFSPILFEGTFLPSLQETLREAFYGMLPVTVKFSGEQILSVEVQKPTPDFSYELT
jgi:hypothetical protein